MNFAYGLLGRLVVKEDNGSFSKIWWSKGLGPVAGHCRRLSAFILSTLGDSKHHKQWQTNDSTEKNLYYC